MSLVAYDNSDISDSEDEEETKAQNNLPTLTNVTFPTEAPNFTKGLLHVIPNSYSWTHFLGQFYFHCRIIH